MASTPSASALSAVLRCRGKIWTRNPPTKRPAASVYSLGLAGGVRVVRDSPAERTGSNQASAWEAFLQGEPVAVGKRLTVARKEPRGSDRRGINKFSKLSQSQGQAHSGVQNALVRQLTRAMTYNLRGTDKCSQIVKKIKGETRATRICKMLYVQEISDFPAGVLKVSVTSPCLVENAGQIPSFVLTGWSTVKSSCISLTALVSQLMFLKLAVLCRPSSSSGDAPQHLLSQQDEENIENDALQVNGHIHNPGDLISTKNSSGQRSTGDRPD